MIPWLLICKIMIDQGKTLRQLVDHSMQAYPSSGEISMKVRNAKEIMRKVKGHYLKQHAKLDEIEGISVEFQKWRFNLRTSNTEPLLRLNVESKQNTLLMQQKRDEVIGLINTYK